MFITKSETIFFGRAFRTPNFRVVRTRRMRTHDSVSAADRVRAALSLVRAFARTARATKSAARRRKNGDAQKLYENICVKVTLRLLFSVVAAFSIFLSFSSLLALVSLASPLVSALTLYARERFGRAGSVSLLFAHIFAFSVRISLLARAAIAGRTSTPQRSARGQTIFGQIAFSNHL